MLWSDATGTDWLTPASWMGAAVPGTSDNAQFGLNPTPGTSVGMSLAGTQQVGAIEMTSDRTSELTIGNSGTTSTGLLQLNGATVNGVANTIIRNNSSSLLALTNNAAGGSGSSLGIVLSNATSNIINTDGAGGITISSVISGSYPLSKTGTGTLTLNTATANTGLFTLNSGTVVLGLANAISANVGPTNTYLTLNGGTLELNGKGITGSNRGVTLNGGTIRNSTSTTCGIGGNIVIGGNISIIGEAGLINFTGVNSQIVNGSITLGGAVGGNFTAGAATTSGPLDIVKNDAGTWTFNKNILITTGPNTTTINAGTLQLNPNSNYTLNSAVVLNGGTFSSAGFAGAIVPNAKTLTLSTLKLQSSSSITLGTNSANLNSLKFAASNAVSWTSGATLTINDWTGTVGAAGTIGRVFVGTSNSGLTAAQLSQISFTGYAGSAMQLNTGEIVPIPAQIINIVTAVDASTLGLNSYSVVTVANGGTLNIDATSTINSLTIQGGGKVTLNSTFSLTTGTLSIQSDVTNGTGTFVDGNANGGLTVNGTTSVQQYLASARNWYLSSPVSSATTSAGNTYYKYVEALNSGSSWTSVSNGVSYDKMVGYIAKAPSANTISFTGTLYNGDQSITGLTSTCADPSKAGFNLVGNPYPSYVNWDHAGNTKTNLSSTIWYRTKNNAATPVYVFDTYGATAGVGTNLNGLADVTGNIPPMQAFWVRVNAGQTGVLGFTNAARSHADVALPNNKFRAPSAKNATQQVLRLQISNGTNNDEAIVLFNPNASNGFEDFDSPKMSNGNPAIPEIYTTAGTEKLVINGLNSLTPNQELPLAFTTGESNAFTLKATEFRNFDADMKVYIKDKLLNSEQELTDGTPYNFNSDVASASSRFSIVFKSAGVTTGVDKRTNDQSILIYKNANNQIAVNCKGDVCNDASVSVYNAVGQKLFTHQITSTISVIGSTFTSGVYIVTVNNGSKSTTQKVIFN